MLINANQTGKCKVKLSVLFMVCVLVCAGMTRAESHAPTLDDYNIVWTEQSKNASESMPLVGGDIGCNVWVENGDILFYACNTAASSEGRATAPSRTRDLQVTSVPCSRIIARSMMFRSSRTLPGQG